VVPGSYPIGYSNGVLRTHIEYKVKGPGVFTGRSGTIGKVHYVEENYWPHNTTLWVTNFKNNYPKFIYFLYKNMKFERFDAGSGVPTLNRNDIHALKRYIPDYNEQKKIVLFLNQLEAKVEKQKEKIELLKEQKKGYMQKIFNRELRFKDENGKAFPDWKEIKLGDICKVSNGNSDVQDTVENGKYPFFDRSIEKRNLNEYHFNNEALIYSGEGSKFYPRYFKGKYGLHQRCYTLYNFEEAYLTKFFYYRMSMLDSNNYFLKVAVGTTVKSLRMENFHKYKLLVPSYREQEKIVSFLQLLDMELKENQFKYNCFISQKRGFMQQMFV